MKMLCQAKKSKKALFKLFFLKSGGNRRLWAKYRG
jgi:hypothetical protein